MPTATYVARDFNADPSTFGFTPGVIVGTDPLDVSDGDTGHVESKYVATGSSTTHTEVTFRLVQESGPTPPTSGVEYVLTFDVAYEVESTEPTLPFLFVGTFAASHGGRTLITHSTGPVTYTLYTGLVAATSGVGFGDDILAEFVDPGSDQYWRVFTGTLGAAVFGTNDLRVTYLRAHLTWTAGERHLRQRNRDTIRARNLASRQRGIRARGYL